MPSSNWFEKYRFSIIIILSIVIFAGLIYLYLDNKKSKEINYEKEITALNAKITDLENNLNNNKKEPQVAGETTETTDKTEEDIQTTNEETDEQNKININDATQEELETLSGIGATKAADIIKYREENNGFKSIDEITNVKGIGEATFAKIKNQITVE